MRAFLNQPVEPQTGVIECMIRRKKGVMNTVYQAYYEVRELARTSSFTLSFRYQVYL